MLDREQKLRGRSDLEPARLSFLKRELQDCLDAPLALRDLASIRTLPGERAFPLLMTRTRLLAAQEKRDEARETIETLCDLPVDRSADSLGRAVGLVECLGILDEGNGPGEIDDATAALRSRCADVAVRWLSEGVERGSVHASQIQGEEAFQPIREHPGFQAIVSREKPGD